MSLFLHQFLVPGQSNNIPCNQHTKIKYEFQNKIQTQPNEMLKKESKTELECYS